MAGRLRQAVILICLVALWNGCARDLPVPIMIESRWNDEETELILEAFDEWNKVGREYLGTDMLEYQGRYYDEDGYTPHQDYADDVAVVYLGRDDEYWEWINETDEHEGLTYTVGYGTYSDIVVFLWLLKWLDPETGIRHLERETFKLVTMHELGHFLGLGHVPGDESALMYETITSKNGPYITPKDIEQLCIIYGCVKDPYD